MYLITIYFKLCKKKLLFLGMWGGPGDLIQFHQRFITIKVEEFGCHYGFENTFA